MNVVYILHSVDANEGSSKAIKCLLEGLMAKGVKPTVVLPRREGLYWELSRMGINVIAVPMRPSAYPKCDSFKKCLLLVPRLVYWHLLNECAHVRLLKLLKGKHVDLIHTNVSIVSVGFRLSKRLKVPHVLHIREYFDTSLHKWYFPSMRYFRKICASPHAYTICITKDIQKHYGLTGVKSSCVVYDGVCRQGTLAPVGDKKRYFLFAGKIYSVKGVLELLKAYCEYVRAAEGDAVPLLIAGAVGNDAYYRKVISYVENHGIKDKVSFLGQRDDVDELMRHALATVIPSLFEGFGFCMVEAMFNKCLVIGRNTGGTKEQFDNGMELCGKEIGLRFDTEEQLARHLVDVAAHAPACYDDMIRMAADTVSQLYSTETHVENVYGVYKTMLAEEHGGEHLRNETT